jgi:hypothetical protein
MAIKYTVWPYNLQNGNKKYQHLQLQGLAKFAQISQPIASSVAGGDDTTRPCCQALKIS